MMLAELQRVKIEDSFDKQPMLELSSEEIDFRVASELFSPVKKLTSKDLESLELVTTYQGRKVPTVAGILLFGKQRLQYFPDAWIQVGRFAGESKTEILDTQDITSNLIVAIDEVIAFVKKHSMRGIAIKGARHTETWNIPIEAVREAIINAVVHADYSQQGSPIWVSIFDDRIVIESPGLLIFGLTIPDIKSGLSKLRNRVIGQVFKHLGLIEQWGSGVTRIIEKCTDFGFESPFFEEIGTHFRVTIFTESVREPTLNNADREIIEALHQSTGLSTKDIAAKIGKSTRMTRYRLVQLVQLGLVIEIGKGPNDPGKKYYLPTMKRVS